MDTLKSMHMPSIGFIIAIVLVLFAIHYLAHHKS